MAIRIKLKPSFFNQPLGKEEFKVGDIGIEVNLEDVEDDLLLNLSKVCELTTGRKFRVFKMERINRIIPLISEWYEEV